MGKMEYDISEIAWETYKLLYGSNFKIIENKNRLHIESTFSLEGKTTGVLSFSGETDFNFKVAFAHSRREAYIKHLKDLESSEEKEKYFKVYKNKFEICEKLMYSVVNISMMPQTGNLQNTKRGIGNDRIDTFIYVIENYYDGIDNLLMNYSSAENIEFLKQYFKMFSSAKEYCATIYHINESLVDELIESGKNPIDTPERVIQYMNLAYRFWCQKLKFFNGFDKVSDSMKQELNKVAELLDKWF
ncbi:MAG: hypothetical protein GX962_09360 [Epulopiscium sp.]|nr:hypothetical protein [Candidatus Epulonipiscium sp.]